MTEKKNTTIEPKIAKGFRDIFADDIFARRKMIETIRGVYEKYGFEPLETPAMEYVETLGKFLPESDEPEGGIFSLLDSDKSWMALRYDMTAPLSRVVAANPQTIPIPFRRYQHGPVWRNEKPGPGRFREFYQFDFDTVGADTMAADAEACVLMAESLEALGIARGDYVVRVNNRKVLTGLLEKIGVSSAPKASNSNLNVQPTASDYMDKDDHQSVERWTEHFHKIGLSASQNQGGFNVELRVLRSMDKLDRLGLDGVRELLQKGRKDESGDFTPGAQLDDAKATLIIDFLKTEGGSRKEIVARLRDIISGSEIGEEGVSELEEIDACLLAAGVGDERVIFDPSAVRGLEYYTGPVFEAVLTFVIKDKKGRPQQFGSVAGGGRYDGLVERFTGTKTPATGASIGVDRLLAALKALGKFADEKRPGPVVVAVMDQDRLSEYIAMVSELREAGIRAEVYMRRKGLRQQAKYADRRQAPALIIAGGDEFERGEVSIKDLLLGAKLAEKVEDHEEWRKGQPAQYSVPRGDLVAAIKKLLAKYETSEKT